MDKCSDFFGPYQCELLDGHAEAHRFDSPVMKEHDRKLKDAVMLLRMVLARKGDLLCLRDKIREWLKRNGLEGSVAMSQQTEQRRKQERKQIKAFEKRHPNEFLVQARKENGHSPKCCCRRCSESAEAKEQDFRESPEHEAMHDAMESLRLDNRYGN